MIVGPPQARAGADETSPAVVVSHYSLENIMANEKGPNIKKKQKCKNCEGKGLLKKGDKVVKCQRCGGTGFR
jgi:DnaJ-class molecular chaperone